MDIHRCRFVPFPPGAINAIAFSHPRPDTKAQVNNVRVAIGRDNGNIELWNPRKGDWQQEKIIYGGKDRSIDSLAWITGPDRKVGDATTVGPMRLFSTGYTSTVTEWDLVEGKPRSHASGPHADIWCMASISNSSPSGNNNNNSNSKPVTPRIVVGTANGELAMYSVKDDELRFDKIIARSTTKGMKMLSVAFQNPRTVVVGCSDGTIRVYDILKGMLLRKMTLGADLTGGAREIIVWAVKCLPGGDIVSADSSGQVCIWDGRTYTQAQRIQSHDQDALSLACSMDGNVIVSGGMDRRTIVYKKNSGTNRWSRIWGRRYHEHDVKTLATFEVADTSVVMAGGPDATPVLIPLKEAGMENHRRLPMLPHRTPLQSAPASRLIASWWGQEVHIWTLRKSFGDLLTEKAHDDKDVRENWKLLKNILIKDDSNITSASISADGSLLVVATNMSIKAFRISFTTPLKPSTFQLASVPLPEDIGATGAQTVKISPNGKWLAIVRGCDSAYVVPVVGSGEAVAIGPAAQRLKRFTRDVGKAAGVSGLGRYDRSIVQLAFSADSNMLAAADLAGYVDTWVVESSLPVVAQTKAQSENKEEESDNDDEDENSAAGAAWVKNPRGALLPKLAGSPAALAFSNYVPTRPEEAFATTDAAVVADDYTLLAVTANFHVTSFNPLRGTLTRWARRNHRSALPVQMQETRDVVKGIMWEGQRAWLYGISFVFMLDMSQDLERPVDVKNAAAAAAAAADEASRKRKRSAHDSGAGGKMARGTLGPVAISKQTTGSAAVTEVFEYDTYRRNGAKSANAAARAEGDEDEEDEEAGSDGEPSELAKRRAHDLHVRPDGSEAAKAKPFGYTFKYRHILGLVPLATGAKDGGIEVALVERPLWEVDLPERFEKTR